MKKVYQSKFPLLTVLIESLVLLFQGSLVILLEFDFIFGVPRIDKGPHSLFHLQMSVEVTRGESSD